MADAAYTDLMIEDYDRSVEIIREECIIARCDGVDEWLRRELKKVGGTREDSPGLVLEADQRMERVLGKPFTGSCTCSGCRAYRDEPGIPQPPEYCTRCALHADVLVLKEGHVCTTPRRVRA